MKTSDVDLENGTLCGVLRQIRYDINNIDLDNPPLIGVWSCEISPSSTKKILSFIKEFITPYDPHLFVHIKRLQKVEHINNSSEPKLKCILCSEDFVPSEEKLRNLIDLNLDFRYDFINVQKVYIPKDAPPTKEVGIDWSSKYWPMAWKGNPNHQFLKSVVIDINEEKRMIQKVLSEIEKPKGIINPSVTIIAKRVGLNYEILSITKGKSHGHPLEHSIMLGIKDIAEVERKRRACISGEALNKNENNYLCHNLVVFTSIEPCVMCCMALLHSRIGKLVYMKEASTGALGSNYQLGDREGLNWKFEIWKWLGKENDILDEFIQNIDLDVNF